MEQRRNTEAAYSSASPSSPEQQERSEKQYQEALQANARVTADFTSWLTSSPGLAPEWSQIGEASMLVFLPKDNLIVNSLNHNIGMARQNQGESVTYIEADKSAPGATHYDQFNIRQTQTGHEQNQAQQQA